MAGVARTFRPKGLAAQATHAFTRASGAFLRRYGKLGGALTLSLLVLAVGWESVVGDARADVLHGSPDTYRVLLRQLKPGDVLELGPGVYDGLPIHDLHGRADAPITVAGHPDKTVIVANPSRNTVSVMNTSHVVIRDLRLDGRGIPTDGVVCERQSSWAHHVTIQNLTIINFGSGRFTVGIATRCPAWGWIIRGNRIVKPGTGMYLGNFDGTGPFFAATIEDNEILNPIGYGIQIKHQIDRPQIEGMPSAKSVTVIRRNRIVKSEGASAGKDARPSLLVGHFPVAGAGSQDSYLIYSNLFYDNPSEALFQGEGNIALYNNLLVNPRGDAVHVQPHNDRPRAVFVFNNTVIAAGVGISVKGGKPGYEQRVDGNAVFASRPLAVGTAGRNFVASPDRAPAHLVNPDGPLSALDLNPRGDTLNAGDDVPTAMQLFPEARADYLGVSRTAPVFGACMNSIKGNAANPCR